jgi:GntR family transcriptional regulator
MVPEASGGRPKYWLIAAGLRDAIESGRYLPGSRLPGENDVMKDHGVARGTARQALTQLVTWGIAEPRKGSGIYVREFRPIIREGITRLGQATWPSGQSVWTAETQGRALTVDQIEVRETIPPEHVRELLGLAVDASAVVRSRRFVLDGKPVLLSRSWLPASIASGTAITSTDTGPGGTYARLTDLGHAPARFREDLRSRMPQPDEADRMDIKPGTPVVDIIRLAVDADGTPVEVNEMTADASAYVFRYEFTA